MIDWQTILEFLSFRSPGQKWAEYCDKGDYFNNIRQYPQAIANYTKAIELKPEYEHIDILYYSRAMAFYSSGKYPEAIQDFDSAKASGLKSSSLFYPAVPREDLLVPCGMNPPQDLLTLL